MDLKGLGIGGQGEEVDYMVVRWRQRRGGGWHGKKVALNFSFSV